MIARTNSCFRSGKHSRDPLCSSGEVISLANCVRDCTTWGKITSRRMPPAGVFEEWARRLKCSVATVRKMWEQGMI